MYPVILQSTFEIPQGSKSNLHHLKTQNEQCSNVLMKYSFSGSKKETFKKYIGVQLPVKYRLL